MLPYDAVFLVPFAVVTLSLTLYFTLLMKLKPTTETKLSTYIEEPAEKKPQKKSRTLSAVKTTEPTPIRDDTDEKECPHYVGYLTTLPKGSGFPDECFGCRKVIQCLRIEPTKVIESFYLTSPETK